MADNVSLFKDVKSVAQVVKLEKELNELKKGFKKAEKQKAIDIIKDKLKLGNPVKFHLNKKIVDGIIFSMSLGNSIGVQYTDTKGKKYIVSRAIINLPEQPKK